MDIGGAQWALFVAGGFPLEGLDQRDITAILAERERRRQRLSSTAAAAEAPAPSVAAVAAARAPSATHLPSGTGGAAGSSSGAGAADSSAASTVSAGMPHASSPAAPTLTLKQAPSFSGVTAAADAQRAAKIRMEQNRWPCTCKPDPSKRGFRDHVPACKREEFTRAGDSGRNPSVGEIVHCLSCAGGRAGWALVCKTVSRGGWVRLPERDLNL